MRRLMRDEWQFGLGQISSLQRHPKPEISTGPPHPGAEMTTPTPDNAARAQKGIVATVCLVPHLSDHFAGVEMQLYGSYEPRIGDEYYSAATVTALEAESKEFQRMFYAMTDARNAEAERADAAERRVAELEAMTGKHDLGNGERIECHVIVGVNVWRGDKWLAFNQCSPEEFKETLATLTGAGAK